MGVSRVCLGFRAFLISVDDLVCLSPASCLQHPPPHPHRLNRVQGFMSLWYLVKEFNGLRSKGSRPAEFRDLVLRFGVWVAACLGPMGFEIPVFGMVRTSV